MAEFNDENLSNCCDAPEEEIDDYPEEPEYTDAERAFQAYIGTH